MLTHYINQFQAIFNGEPWFGDSFDAKLSGLSEADAFRRPSPVIHSVAELVSHCIYWRQPLIKILQGDTTYKGSMKDEKNWMNLEKLKPKGWATLLTEWETSQEELISLLSKAPAKFLDQPFQDSHTMRHLVEGILQHDIYHLGQIGLVKKLVG